MQRELTELYDLLDAHRKAGRDQAAKETLEQIIALVPMEPVPRIALAEQLSLMNLFEAAFSAAGKALEVAKVNGNFVRQATGVLIRAALDVKAYGTVEQSLSDLIAYSPAHGAVDIGPERDFLKRLPPNTISASVIAKYKEKFANPPDKL